MTAASSASPPRAGRWLSRATGAGFVAEVWLENDGDLASQAEAGARPRPDADAAGLVLHVAQTRARPDASPLRRATWMAVVPETPEGAVPPGCTLVGPDWLDAAAPSRSTSGRWRYRGGGGAGRAGQSPMEHPDRTRERWNRCEGASSWTAPPRPSQAGFATTDRPPEANVPRLADLSSCGSAPPDGPARGPGRPGRRRVS